MGGATGAALSGGEVPGAGVVTSDDPPPKDRRIPATICFNRDSTMAPMSGVGVGALTGVGTGVDVGVGVLDPSGVGGAGGSSGEPIKASISMGVAEGGSVGSTWVKVTSGTGPQAARASASRRSRVRVALRSREVRFTRGITPCARIGAPTGGFTIEVFPVKLDRPGLPRGRRKPGAATMWNHIFRAENLSITLNVPGRYSAFLRRQLNIL